MCCTVWKRLVFVGVDGFHLIVIPFYWVLERKGLDCRRGLGLIGDLNYVFFSLPFSVGGEGNSNLIHCFEERIFI